MKKSINDFLANNRETAQLAYGIILIILIPLLIAFNTLFIINKYNEALDLTLQKQALTIGRTVYALIKQDMDDYSLVQEKINNLMWNNVQFEELSILEPSAENFAIVASSKKENIGRTLQFYYYNVAWTQPDNDGLATDSLQLAKTVEGEWFETNVSPDERYWLVAMPMKDASGNKKALLSIQISSKVVDDLTKYNRNFSIYFLIGTVFIVILFLLIAVRLWDYVLLYRKMKEVDKMKDDFISMASHELRTPVTSIRGYLSMMLDGSFGEINEKMKNSLAIVSSATERLSELVDDLLDVNRIEQGRMKIEPVKMDIAPVIVEIINEMKAQADQKKLVLNFLPHKLRLPAINIDPARLKQILINIIGNAIKYTNEGKVDIMTGEKNNGTILEVKVKDSGIGISAKERERLFEKFYRVRNESTKKTGGTGLGLWITKQLVEKMGGMIMVDSMEGIGTQVTIQFSIIRK